MFPIVIVSQTIIFKWPMEIKHKSKTFIGFKNIMRHFSKLIKPYTIFPHPNTKKIYIQPALAVINNFDIGNQYIYCNVYYIYVIME